MTFAVVIPFHLFYGAAAYAPEGEWDGETFRFWYSLVLFRITVYVFRSLWSFPRRVRRLRPPPVPNILWLSLGSTFSWRCTTHRRRPTQPRHYHLIRRIRRRSRLRSRDRPPFCEQPPRTPPWTWPSPTEEERQDAWDQLKHRVLHVSYFQFDLQFGISLADFVGSFDPLHQFHLLQELQTLPMTPACGQPVQDYFNAAVHLESLL